MFTIVSASGNVFGYAWQDEVPADFDGSLWARRLCPRGTGLGLDGIFLVGRPEPHAPWVLEHWDTDGGRTFCSNGSRGALALPGAPEGLEVAALSSGEAIALQRLGDAFAIRMPSGPGFGFLPSPLTLAEPHICAWIGNPQLVVEVPDTAKVDLAVFAPPLRHHPGFAQGTNVSVLTVLAPGSARIRSFERGVEAETCCCGTGCAVAAAWLTRRTGLDTWTLLPTGGDPVTVTTALEGPTTPEGSNWRDLWLSGGATVLGTFTPLF